MSGKRVAGADDRVDHRPPESASDPGFGRSAVNEKGIGTGMPPLPARKPVSGGIAGSSVSGKDKLILRLLMYLALVVLMANLNAMVDTIMHPQLRYFNHEHLIVGGVTALVVVTLLGALEVYLARRKRTEEALKTSEARYRGVVEDQTELLCRWRPDGSLTFVNQAYARYFGKPKEKLLGTRFLDLLPGMEREEAARQVAVLCSALSPDAPAMTFDTRIVSGSGEARWHQWTDRGIFDPEGRLVEIQSLGQDITERKQAETEYRTILATTMDGFWITDHQGRFRDVNAAACRHLGYSREELLGGMGIRDIEAAETPDETAARIRRIREEGKDRFETLHRRKDGTLIDVEVSVHHTDIGGGGWFAFIRDITERKRAEEALRNLHAGLERKVRERTAELAASNEQLQETQRQQKALLDSIPDLAWLKDKESRFIAVNQPFGEACGVDPAKLVGRTDLDIWPKELAEAYRADDRLVMESRRIRRVEEPLVGSQGQRSWIETIKAPILDDQGRVIGTAGVARDVTERLRAEEELRKSEERYRVLAEEFRTLAEEFRALLDAIPDAVYFKDREGRHRFVNRSFERSMGLSQEAVIGKGADDLFPPEMAQTCRLSDGEVYEKRSAIQVEDAMTGPDGAMRLFETTKAPLFDEGGEVAGLVGLTRDITQRKRIETALRESQEKYQALVETIGDCVWEVDRKGIFTYVSPRIRDLLGYEPEEVLGKTSFDLMPPDEARRVGRLLQSLSVSHLPIVALENVNVHKDGRLVVLETSGTPIFNADGTLRGYRGVDRDITARKEAEVALKESEERFRRLFDQSPLGAALVALDFRFLRVNETLSRITGYSPEELASLTFADITHPDDVETDVAQAKRLLAGEIEQYEMEKRYIRKDGGIVWVRLNVRGIRDEASRLLYCLPIVEDITQHKRDEAQLLAYRERLEKLVEERTAELKTINERLEETQRQQKALLDSIPDIAWLKDRESRYIAVNQPYGQVLGVDPSDLVGKTDFDIWPRETAEAYRAADRQVMESGRMKRVEDPLVDSRGQRSLFETIKAPILDDQGRVIGTAGIARDITERKKAEAALQESEERFRSLVESSLIGFFIVQKGEIVFTNPEQKRLFGGCWKECAASDFQCIHPQDRDRFLALCDGSLIESGGKTEAVIRHCPDGFPEGSGSMRWFHCRATPIRYRGEKAVLVNMLDITQLREMERIALTQEKMASLGQVATGVAHEIRNPLSGLNIHLGALGKTLEEAEGLEPEARETTQTILKMALSASGKIDGIVRRVMDLANPAPPKMGSVSVNACMRETLHLAGVTLRKAGVRLTMALQTGLPKAWGDDCLLEQVLLNLLTNAAQAMEGQDREKRIEVSSGMADGHVTISVADSGPGVPEDIRERIFDPFFTTKKEGTGIGLSFSHRVVSDHGGFIRVGRSRWDGALFTIGLPAGDQGTI